MRKSKMVKVSAALLAISVGGAVAAFTPAAPAVAFFSQGLFLDVQVESPGTLLARGAAVDVPVEVTCNASQAFVSVTLTQRVGSEIASGSGFATVGCTGGGQRIVVTVTAFGDKAFRKQTAFAEATISGCNDGVVCGEETDSATIDLQR
jgi:hypothetical protein